MSANGLSVENLGDGVVRLTLRRAPVNALTPEYLDALSALYDEISTDVSVRALVISSAQKVFSAGLDLKAALKFDRADELEIVRALNQSFTKLYALPKPTICAVNGAAIAGGFFFVVGCDYRVASSKASAGLAEVRVGATLPVGPMEIARAELKPDDLRRMVLNGQPLDADRALTAGVFDEVVEPDALKQRALEVAEAYAKLPPKTYSIAKELLRSDTVQRIEQAMENGANAPEGGWFTDETKVAMAAMING